MVVLATDPEEFEAKLAIVQVDRGDQVELVEKFQGSVDSGDIHGGTAGVNSFVNPFDGSMTCDLVHGGQYHLSLRREPESALTKSSEEELLAAHCYIPLLLQLVAITIILQLSTCVKGDSMPNGASAGRSPPTTTRR